MNISFGRLCLAGLCGALLAGSVSLPASAVTVTWNGTVLFKDGFEDTGQELAPADADPRHKMWQLTEPFPYSVQVVEGEPPGAAEGKRYLRLHTFVLEKAVGASSAGMTNVHVARAKILFKQPIAEGKLVWEFSAFLDENKSHTALFSALPADRSDAVYHAVFAVSTPLPNKGPVNYLGHNENIPLDGANRGGTVRYQAGRWQAWVIEAEYPKAAAPRFRVSVDGSQSDWLPMKNSGPIGGLRFALGASERRLLIDAKSTLGGRPLPASR